MFKDAWNLGKTWIEKAMIIAILILFLAVAFFIPSFSALPVYNVITIGMVVVLCVLILLWKIIYRKILIDRFALAIVCFNLCIFVSNLLSRDGSFIFTYLTVSGTAICLYQLFLEKELRPILRFIMFVGFFAFAGYFVISYRDIILNFAYDRIGDKFDNLNTVGYYFTYAFAITISMVDVKKKLSFFYIIPLLLFTFLSFRTGSRSSLIIILLCAFIYPFIYFKKLTKKNVFIPIIIDVVMFALFALAVVVAKFALHVDVLARMGEFFKSLIGKSIDYSSENRVELFLESFRLFLRRPIFGWGNNVFSIYSSERLFAHNNITELLFSFGVIGFAFYEVIILSPFLTLIDCKGEEKGKTFCMSFLLVISIFLVQLFYVNSQLKYDWILLAFIASEAKLIKMSRPENEIPIEEDEIEIKQEKEAPEIQTLDLSI